MADIPKGKGLCPSTPQEQPLAVVYWPYITPPRALLLKYSVLICYYALLHPGAPSYGFPACSSHCDALGEVGTMFLSSSDNLRFL